MGKTDKPEDPEAPNRFWKRALAYIEENDLGVLDWAKTISPETFKRLTSKQFLRQYCYVVYASGFKAATIQAVFPDLKAAFKDFDIDSLSRMRSLKQPLEAFGNERKAQNFLDGAKAIADEGWRSYKTRVASEGVDGLVELPGIGPITKDHLAKNIGLADVAKADIWLQRAAQNCGMATPDDLIDAIQKKVNESRHVIDVVIWYFGKECGFEPKEE